MCWRGVKRVGIDEVLKVAGPWRWYFGKARLLILSLEDCGTIEDIPDIPSLLYNYFLQYQVYGGCWIIQAGRRAARSEHLVGVNEKVNRDDGLKRGNTII